MKMKMKAILIAMLAVVGLFTACSKSDDAVVFSTIGFTGESFLINENSEAIFKVSSSAPTTGEVGYTIQSNLVEGEDYQVLEKAFSFTNTSEATITVKFLKPFQSNGTFAIELNPINFGQLALAKATIGINPTDAILYTFDKNSYEMTNSVDVIVKLSKVTGSLKIEQDLALEVEVDPSSTAVEGVHFSFAEEKVVKIGKGKINGTIKLKFIKLEEGKDKIVLRLKNLPILFRVGNYDLANIKISGDIFPRLQGSWEYKAMTNLDWIILNTKYFGDDTKLYPTNNTSADVLKFTEDGLQVTMTGVLNNYFRDSKIVNLGEVDEMLQEEPDYLKNKMVLVEAMVNVNFSETTINERKAAVGFRIIPASNGGKEVLEVTIRDYEPTDFLQNTFKMYQMMGETPVFLSFPLRYHFERVN